MSSTLCVAPPLPLCISPYPYIHYSFPSYALLDASLFVLPSPVCFGGYTRLMQLYFKSQAQRKMNMTRTKCQDFQGACRAPDIQFYRYLQHSLDIQFNLIPSISKQILSKLARTGCSCILNPSMPSFCSPCYYYILARKVMLLYNYVVSDLPVTL